MRKKMGYWAIVVILALIVCGCGEKSQDTGQVDTVQPVIVEEEASSPVEDILDVFPEDYAYSITVSINPMIELYLDHEDAIVGVAYLNDDAIDAYKELELIGSSLSDCMNMIVTAATDKGYLKEGGQVEVELSRIAEGADVNEEEVLLSATQEMDKALTLNGVKLAEGLAEEPKSDSNEANANPKKSSVCPDCNGTGNSCKECNGTGDVSCKRCNNGIESCGTCHGSAVINCHGCHGAGVDGPQNETCRRCGGSGVQACDACNGAGTFTCSWCKGKLHHVCPECWNEGSCSTCGGDGII